jgi:hypothetical protein
VIAADIDETCLDHVYANARSLGMPVQAVYLDIVWPLGSGGAFNTMRAAPDRLRCDLVLALALAHHVCVRRRFDPDAFVGAVASYSASAAVLEFVPEEDWHVQQWGLPPLAGYTADAFARACGRRFERVQRIASDPAPREYFVCEGRRR